MPLVVATTATTSYYSYTYLPLQPQKTKEKDQLGENEMRQEERKMTPPWPYLRTPRLDDGSCLASRVVVLVVLYLLPSVVWT